MLIEARDLRFSYGRREALHGLDLDVARGEVVCLSGANGAGKSTTLAVFAGLHQEADGEVLVAGCPPGSAAARRSVGYVAAVPPLYDYLSVREHLDLLARLRGLEPSDAERAGRRMQLLDLLDVLAGQLSLGQRQRLALALVLLHDPPLLLMDEPFNGLDAATSQLIRRQMREHAATGGSVVVATHLLDALEGLATRLVLLHEGRVLADLSPCPGQTLSELFTSASPQFVVAKPAASAGGLDRVGAL